MSYDVLTISQDDIKSLGITMEEMLAEVERGWKLKGEGLVELPPKPGVHPRENCYIHAMPCFIGGEVDAAGLKWVAGFPANLQKNLPYNNGLFCLNDTNDGLVKAVMDANWMTTWRTGAASGVGAKYFAPPATSTLALLGLGTIGRINMRAIKTALPAIERVHLFDPLKTQADGFIAELGPLFPDVEYIVADTMEKACAGAQIVVSAAPIIEHPARPLVASWLDEDALVITTDYDSTLNECALGGVFVCDDKGQYLWTQAQGVYFQNGYPTKEGIYADMGEVVAGKAKPVTSGRRTCVFMGIASHDLMTANLIYKRAMEKKIGTWIKL